jgi:hypothetical protein
LKGTTNDIKTGNTVQRDYYITFDGYNLSKAEAFLVPKNLYTGNLTTF